MKAVSFSLWGDKAMYTQGCIRNAELMPTIYPGWKMVVYMDGSVPSDVVQSLIKLNVEIRKPWCSNGMFWRFGISDDPKAEAFIIRDTDSRINQREAGAVKEWLDSRKGAHVLADHPAHSPVMGGGLWGARHGVIKGMTGVIQQYGPAKLENDRKVTYNSDQIFLRDFVWPLIEKDVLIHDLCHHRLRLGAVPFPSKFGDDRFVGEVFDAQDRPRSFDADMRLNWQEP